ncbi:hypothetical protein NGUA15_04490 [Salmonella enterica]|nr:hypothetical protein NGUA15_04490 [Salmonella enterica]
MVDFLRVVAIALFFTIFYIDTFEVERFHINNFRFDFITQTFTHGVNQHAVVLIDSPGKHAAQAQFRCIFAFCFDSTRRIQG